MRCSSCGQCGKKKIPPHPTPPQRNTILHAQHMQTWHQVSSNIVKLCGLLRVASQLHSRWMQVAVFNWEVSDVVFSNTKRRTARKHPHLRLGFPMFLQAQYAVLTQLDWPVTHCLHLFTKAAFVMPVKLQWSPLEFPRSGCGRMISTYFNNG